MPLTREQEAREDIDKALAQAGRVIQDPPELNLSAGCGAAIRELPLVPVERPSTRPRALLSAPGLALLVLAACGDASDSVAEPGPGGLLSMAQLGGASHEQSEVARRLEPPPQLDPWRHTADTAAVREIELPGEDGTVRALTTRGEEGYQITIPGHFDDVRFNHIVVRLRTRGLLVLTAKLSSEGKVFGKGGTLIVRGDPGLQTIAFHSPRWPPAEKFDAIKLLLKPGAKSWDLIGVDLAYVSLEELYPSVDGPGTIPIAGESRRGFALTLAGPVGTLVRVPPHARLDFGLHAMVVGHEQSPELVLSVQPESSRIEAVTKRWQFSYQDVRAPWTSVSVPMPEEGGTMRVEFSLSAGGGEAVEPAAIAITEPRVVVPDPTRRSVLLVTIDTQREDHMGTSRRGVGVETPALDGLAATGVYFDDCLSSTNITLPSHAALLTGIHPRDTGLQSNQAHLADRAVTLAECFREAGYTTLAVTSSGVLTGRGGGLDQGFDRMSWPMLASRDAGEAVDVLESWLEDVVDRDLFVWLHFNDPHGPYAPPAPFDELYGSAAQHPDEASAEIASRRALYGGEVSYMDSELGRILNKERFESGIVAVTADHGECLGEHGFFGHASLFPQSLQIPLYLAWPGAPAGARVGAGVEQIDVGRTLLDLAGLEGTTFPGRNLTELVTADTPTGEPRFALGAHAQLASITSGPWHLILALKQHDRSEHGERRVIHAHTTRLFQLDLDPLCEDDRVEAEFERARLMRDALVRWLLAADPYLGGLAQTSDPSKLEALAQLGYAGTPEEATDEDLFDASCECERCQRFD